MSERQTDTIRRREKAFPLPALQTTQEVFGHQKRPCASVYISSVTTDKMLKEGGKKTKELQRCYSLCQLPGEPRSQSWFFLPRHRKAAWLQRCMMEDWGKHRLPCSQRRLKNINGTVSQTKAQTDFLANNKMAAYAKKKKNLWRVRHSRVNYYISHKEQSQESRYTS